MSTWRRALLGALVAAFSAILAIACSSFGANDGADTGSADSAADGDAGSSANDAGGTPDGGDAAARFCAQYAATAILCDDFEENDGGILSVWKPTADGGAVVAADAPMRAGHAAKITASGAGAEVALVFGFAPKTAISGVVLDVDMLLDTAEYDYIELVEVHTAGATGAYFGGVAKSGNALGMHFLPHNGPTIMVDGAWHHIQVELLHNGSTFSQKVTIDKTVLEQTTTDLSTMSLAEIRLGVTSPLPPGTLAVIYFDNVLLRSP